MVRKKKKKVVETYTPTRTAPCSHFGVCGGCRLQDLAYEDQLVLKKKALDKLFGKDILLHPAPEEFGYRNRMDFIYHEGKLSLRERNRFDAIVPISSCLLIDETFRSVFDAVQSLLDEFSFESYDVVEKKGFLRYVVFRYAPATKECMIICTSTSVSNQPVQEFLSRVLALDHVVSTYWFVNDSITDISLPFSQPFLVLGKECITDCIGGVMLSYSPHSFFQSNSAMAALAFETMKPFISGNVVDVCCGVGAIGLVHASSASSLLGVEVVADAIRLAQENARANNIDATFIATDMKDILEVTPLDVDTLILDPPRAGLGKKVIKRIVEVDPETIVYLSCNPKTQKLDLAWLSERTDQYELVFHEAFDFFPQTPHVESLVVLRKKRSAPELLA